MSIKESMLNIVSDLAQNDYIRAVTYGGYSRRVEVSELAKSVVEDYTGSSLAGENQSVQGAFSALETEIQNVEQDVTAEINDAIVNILPTDTAAGEIASFPDGSDLSPALSVVAGIEPVQSGSGTPSPTNVRPISGHTEVDVEKRGKNLCDVADGTYNGFIAKVKQGTTYTFSVYCESSAGIILRKNSQSGEQVAYRDVSTAPRRASATFTADEDYDLWINSWGGRQVDFQLELGTTATEYEPYQGQSYNIPLGQTVYGGTLDVVSGLLTVDRVVEIFDGTESGWTTGTAGGGTTFISPILPNAGLNDTTHKQLYNMAEWVQYADRNGMLLNPSNNKIYVGSALTASAFNSDLATFKTYLRNNPLQVCYYLATPQTYQLTPQQVDLLKGYNNVWSEAGDMSVTYKADIQLYIDKQTNELRVAILALS